MAQATAVTTRPGQSPASSSRKTLLGTAVGNALEWYDWNIYASFAIYIAARMFDPSNPTSAFLATMAVFAVGFVARPFGGVLVGWISDRVGRKHGLLLTVIGSSVGSLMIGLAPTFERVGLFASVWLLAARVLQGLAHGGELPSAQTYLAEKAPREHRGFWASSIYVSGTIGITLGLLLGLVMSLTLSETAMAAWGWRIPFILGAVLGLFALWIRTSLGESEVFEEQVKESDAPRESIFLGAVRHWRQALQVIGMTIGLTVIYYIWGVAMASLARQQFGFPAQTAFLVTLAGNVVFIASLPFWGRFSDRFGRKPSLLIATLGSAVLYVPMLALVKQGLWQAIVAISLMLVLIGAAVAVMPAAYAELFPTKVRATAFGIPYALAIAAFGGTAPMLMTALSPAAFTTYAIVLALVTAATVLTLPETKGKDLSEL